MHGDRKKVYVKNYNNAINKSGNGKKEATSGTTGRVVSYAFMFIVRVDVKILENIQKKRHTMACITSIFHYVYNLTAFKIIIVYITI